MNASRVLRATIALVASGLLLYGIARLSAMPLAAHRSQGARIRLSWSARPERIEVCRALSADELAQREEHMRQRVECDGRFATYALRVESDDKLLHESIVRGAGLRHDRPLYLLREIDVAPGAHRFHISFTRREKTDNDSSALAVVASTGPDTGLFAGRAQREAVERARRAAAAIPSRITLDTSIMLQPEQVIVVSFDPEARAFRVLGEPQ